MTRNTKALRIGSCTAAALLAVQMLFAGGADASTPKRQFTAAEIRAAALNENPNVDPVKLDAAIAAYEAGTEEIVEVTFAEAPETGGTFTVADPHKLPVEGAEAAGVCAVHSHDFYAGSTLNLAGIRLAQIRYDVKWQDNCVSIVGGFPDDKWSYDVTNNGAIAGWSWGGWQNGPERYFFTQNGSPFGGWHSRAQGKINNRVAGDETLTLHVDVFWNGRACYATTWSGSGTCGQQ